MKIKRKYCRHKNTCIMRGSIGYLGCINGKSLYQWKKRGIMIYAGIKVPYCYRDCVER